MSHLHVPCQRRIGDSRLFDVQLLFFTAQLKCRENVLSVLFSLEFRFFLPQIISVIACFRTEKRRDFSVRESPSFLPFLSCSLYLPSSVLYSLQFCLCTVLLCSFFSSEKIQPLSLRSVLFSCVECLRYHPSIAGVNRTDQLYIPILPRPCRQENFMRLVIVCRTLSLFRDISE